MPDPLNEQGNEQEMPKVKKTYGYTQTKTKFKSKGTSLNDFDDTVAVAKSPAGYTPYKMKADNNDPMTKNYGGVAVGKMRTFGTKTLEGPKKTDTDPGSGLNYAGGVGSSPAKGIWDKMKSIGKKAMDPLGVLKNALGGGGGGSDPAAQIKAKMEQMKAAVAAAKAGGAGGAAGGGIAAAGGGGEVPQHGAESHSGESVNPEKQGIIPQAAGGTSGSEQLPFMFKINNNN